MNYFSIPATLGTGGWLGLTRQGLAPCKKHQAALGALAVELKVTEFQPEFVGKMQFYLAALDDLVRLPDENPSIGIILCKTKDRVIVEYALHDSRKPIGVAAYRIVSKLPKELKGQLPTTDQIEKLLEDMK